MNRTKKESQRVVVTMPKTDYEKIHKIALDDARSDSNLIAKIIHEYLASVEDKK